MFKESGMFPSETHILVAEDDEAIRDLVSDYCTKLGFSNVTKVGSGKEAWTLLSNKNCSVKFIISDLKMPGGTGLELLKQVRSEGHLRDIPFLMLTGFSDVKNVQDAVRAEVDHFLDKPFSLEDLKGKMELIYKKRTEG